LQVVRTLAQGFSWQGENSPHRSGRPRGEPSGRLPRMNFVNFLQNHDQIGNRPRGQRLTMLAKPRALEAALAILLLQPGPPLMFMGEEWGATEPFPFFCDFKGELAEAVRQGRRREFAEAYAAHGEEIPDPLARQTRDSAVLDWQARTTKPHAARLALVRALLTARRKWVVPLLPAMNMPGEVRLNGGVLHARWVALSRSLLLLANLSDDARPHPPDLLWGASIWGDKPSHELPPWSVYAAIGGD
jgi:1,4-alpha-glucan branching enzyme